MPAPTLKFPPPRRPKLNLGDKLQRIAMLAPEYIYAIEAIVDDVLERRLPPAPKKSRDVA